MKVYFLNSPKRSGKDVVTEEMCENIQFRKMKFADPLYSAVRETFALEEGEWSDLYENHKENPSQRLGGLSPRQAMIWFSEEVVKPKFGEDYYGQLMIERIKQYMDRISPSMRENACIVISDSGFYAEAKPVIDFIGAEYCYHVRLDRDGCEFDETDSRYDWSDMAREEGVRCIRVDNNGFVGDTANQILGESHETYDR